MRSMHQLIVILREYIILKYYTWVEQQGKTYEEIMSQWYDIDFWKNVLNRSRKLTHLLKSLMSVPDCCENNLGYISLGQGWR